MSEILLDVKNLCKYYPVSGGTLHAVDDVSFHINKGETLGLVGESGCGKSTIGRTVLRLIPHTSGEVHYKGENILTCSPARLRSLRRQIQIIFQDPYSCLDPRKTIGQIISEPLVINRLAGKKELNAKVLDLMSKGGVSRKLYNAYPHELDGGRRQRIGIARALAVNPEFIVCDEPVSALDVSIQAQILNLMEDLQEQLGLTYMFITHDLSVVHHFSDDIAVMYLGRLLEKAPSDQLFQNPAHPYTEALLSAIPIPSLHNRRQRILMKGEITSPVNPPKACRFANRCPKATDRCFNEEPELREIGPGHMTACFLYE